MTPVRKIIVQGIGVNILSAKQNDKDFISLTDMAKYKTYDSGVVISNWLTTKYTIQFMGAWEQLHNPNFNLMEFNKIKNEVGTNGFIVSSSMWIKNTNAIGIRSSAGRYGGTFAHKDIIPENLAKYAKDLVYATVEQLVILANLETLNAEFIRQGLESVERLKKLNDIAIIQMRSLLGHPSIKKLSEGNS
ncbi:KilA-N domain-containing protein [Patescibacteria group bacterium]|nr:KilA-N domain-containing protein [Patescibacteria group bacterium]MBU1703128.1 KilA-N domain-containing protein [Patescibacteria group bacterium]MBU1954302.1 KilA-N domain-containing protein [Patescibacteria group bacterium]